MKCNLFFLLITINLCTMGMERLQKNHKSEVVATAQKAFELLSDEAKWPDLKEALFCLPEKELACVEEKRNNTVGMEIVRKLKKVLKNGIAQQQFMLFDVLTNFLKYNNTQNPMNMENKKFETFESLLVQAREAPINQASYCLHLNEEHIKERVFVLSLDQLQAEKSKGALEMAEKLSSEASSSSNEPEKKLSRSSSFKMSLKSSPLLRSTSKQKLGEQRSISSEQLSDHVSKLREEARGGKEPLSGQAITSPIVLSWYKKTFEHPKVVESKFIKIAQLMPNSGLSLLSQEVTSSNGS